MIVLLGVGSALQWDPETYLLWNWNLDYQYQVYLWKCVIQNCISNSAGLYVSSGLMTSQHVDSWCTQGWVILYLIFASPVYPYQVQEGDQGLAECFCQYLPSLSVKSSPRPHCTTLTSMKINRIIGFSYSNSDMIYVVSHIF